MHFKFTKILPKHFNEEIRIISGSDSMIFHEQEYLILQNNYTIVSVFEIKYDYSCSPFKEAKILDSILAVGHEAYFYLFNLDTNNTFLKIKVDGYFGHLYLYNDRFYVTDASGVHCIDKKGKILWENDNLAIDGVTINQFKEDKIYGSGEHNPPGGWENFILNLETGKTIK